MIVIPVAVTMTIQIVVSSLILGRLSYDIVIHHKKKARGKNDIRH